MFTSTLPYRFKITGRTKSFINTFGEELIVDNADQAIAFASKKTGAQIRDYTASPIYMKDLERGGHEWLIEFVQPPDNAERFKKMLDERLRELNSDYDAKRYNNMILDEPLIHYAAEGTFDSWLKKTVIEQLGLIKEFVLETYYHIRTSLFLLRFPPIDRPVAVWFCLLLRLPFSVFF